MWLFHQATWRLFSKRACGEINLKLHISGSCVITILKRYAGGSLLPDAPR